MRVDSPGLDVGDGPLDHRADPVDALVGLLRRLVQFAVGGLLMGRDHSPSHEGYSAGVWSHFRETIL